MAKYLEHDIFSAPTFFSSSKKLCITRLKRTEGVVNFYMLFYIEQFSSNLHSFSNNLKHFSFITVMYVFSPPVNMAHNVFNNY